VIHTRPYGDAFLGNAQCLEGLMARLILAICFAMLTTGCGGSFQEAYDFGQAMKQDSGVQPVKPCIFSGGSVRANHIHVSLARVNGKQLAAASVPLNNFDGTAEFRDPSYSLPCEEREDGSLRCDFRSGILRYAAWPEISREKAFVELRSKGYANTYHCQRGNNMWLCEETLCAAHRQ